MEQLVELEEEISELEEEFYVPRSCLSAGQTVNLLRRMLRAMNPVHIDLAEHTAFCALKIFDYASLHKKMNLNIGKNNLILLSLFFLIGAYKSDEFDFCGDYDGKAQADLFLYSSLFLKYLTPLSEIAEAALLCNCEYSEAKEHCGVCAEYSSLIFTCMRLCLKLREKNWIFDKEMLSEEFAKECGLYNPLYLELFSEANENGAVTDAFKTGQYFSELDAYCDSLQMNYDDTFSLLKMLIYSIDFVSTSTVTHVISTAFYAAIISKLRDLSDEETDEVFTAGIIHDIGKMSVDVALLESSERLTESEMAQMRCHVLSGVEMCRGIVGEKIADIAFRHHEALDGSGYPHGLSGNDLSVQQRVLAVADIFSALSDARTYKTEFSKEQTIEILEAMSRNNKIDREIVSTCKTNYDEITFQAKSLRPLITTNLGHVLMCYLQLKGCSSLPELLRGIREIA